jgi:hypothetical protein
MIEGADMPSKEELEAELQESDMDKAVRRLRETIAHFNEWEAQLRTLEKKVWQPHWSHDDPLADRLLRIGKNPVEIAKIERRLEAFEALCNGRPIQADIQEELDEQMAREKRAEKSATDLLANLIRRS